MVFVGARWGHSYFMSREDYLTSKGRGRMYILALMAEFCLVGLALYDFTVIESVYRWFLLGQSIMMLKVLYTGG